MSFKAVGSFNYNDVCREKYFKIKFGYLLYKINNEKQNKNKRGGPINSFKEKAVTLTIDMKTFIAIYLNNKSK